MPSQESQRFQLIDELAEEFAARYRRGEHPSLQEYVDRYPELADDIRELLPALAEVEQVKAEFRPSPENVPATAPPLQQIGDFRIIREVGRGGMGVVYEAEQVSLARRVALKLLPQKMLLDGKAKQRFEREAKAAAKLHHTNIVPVFGVGEHEELPYFVMQFIQGLGLDDVLDELKRMQGNDATASAALPERRISPARKEVTAADVARSLVTGDFQTVDLVADASPHPGLVVARPEAEEKKSQGTRRPSDPPTLSSSSVILPGQRGAAGPAQPRTFTYWQSVARIGIQVAEALDYAHKQGILHRDIKPSNLLLDAHGTVWVTDFGLAKVDDQQNLTDAGDILGTLRYMPPEAFEGKTDARSEVYALGLTLYELLAFRPAFDETERPKLIRQVTSTEPIRLRNLNRNVPRDLETIVHKAMDREPQRRYATAGELAADLQRFLSDEPIRARRLSAPERLLKWSRRNKGIAALTSIAGLALAAVAVVSLAAAVRLQHERDAVLEEQERANVAEMKTVAARMESLLTAAPDSIPFILDSLRDHKTAVLPELERRWGQWGPQSVEHLRLTVALAALGQDHVAELCERVEHTPAGKSSILTLGLQACDRDKAVAELDRRYQLANAGPGRTRLSIALLTLGDPRAAQTELAVRDNPSDRVRFIHLFPSWHGDLARIPDLLRSLNDPAFRSGLCLAVGGVEPDTMSTGRRQALDQVFAELYTTAVDGGTHGTAAWALGQFRGFDADVHAATNPAGVPMPDIAQTQGPVEGRRWFVNRLGMTMIGIQPGCFHPFSYEPDHRVSTVVLTRPFFMLDQEVTAHWYRGFLDSDDHPPGERLTPASRNADLRFSLARADWMSAVLFCNWLSRQEGRTPCYQIPMATPNVAAVTCDFQANGYRLPTDAEWEYAFRCGSTTRYVTGDDLDRMLDYGRIFATHPGQGKAFLPNPWGLFDLLGNGWEMCWDWPNNRSELAIDPVSQGGNGFAMRGGSADAGLYYLHGSARIRAEMPAAHGFRVVCGPLASGPPVSKHAVLAALSQPGSELLQPAIELRARLYADEGRWAEALADMESALERWPTDTLLGLHAAPVYIEKGDRDGYQRFRRAMLERVTDAQDSFVLERTVKACLLLPGTVEETKLCAELAERAIRNGTANPFKEYFALAAAFAQFRQGNDGAAAAQLGRGRRGEWNWAIPADLLRTMILYRQQQFAAARILLAHTCLMMDATVPSVADAEDRWHDVVICRILRREAVALLSRPHALEPLPVALQNRLALFSLSQALAPVHPRPYYERGEVYRLHGDAGHAIESFNAALACQPENAMFRGLIHVQRARAHMELKQYGDAVADYEAALVTDPKRPFSCNELARLYVTGPSALRDPVKALPLAERAVELVPKRPEFRSTLGIVSYRLGHYEDAVKMLKRSLQLAPGEPAGFDLFFLAMSHHRLGQDKEAGTFYERAIRWTDELCATLPPSQQEQLRAIRAEAAAELAKAAEK